MTVGIISAISGLVGVIVGGIITAVSNYLFTRSTRRQRGRETDATASLRYTGIALD